MEVLRKILTVCVLTLVACSHETAIDVLHEAELTVQEVSFSSWRSIENSRKATVRVVSASSDIGTSMGSGALIKYKKKEAVITAAHVVEGSSKVIVSTDSQTVLAKVIYFDKESDIAILMPEEKLDRKPILWSVSDLYYGQEVVYTGFPNGYDNLSIKGYVSGSMGDRIVIHSYAWGGASGSLVIDSKGKVVGVVSAIDLAQGVFGMPQIVEDLVIVAPVHDLDLDSILN